MIGVAIVKGINGYLEGVKESIAVDCKDSGIKLKEIARLKVSRILQGFENKWILKDL